MLLGVALMFIAAVTHAEIYTAEGTYVMSEGENLGVAKERAKADAMRYACEQAGVYVKTYSRMKNLKLEEDVIETMTANILKLVEEPHFYPLKEVDNLEGVLIRVTIKAQIDDSDITRWLNKDSQEKSNQVSENESLRKAYEEQKREIAELKRRLASNQQDREQIIQEFTAQDKIFLSNQKVDEANKLNDKGDKFGALQLYNAAVELNPNNAIACNGRGTVYFDQKQYELAIQNFDRAIQINPNYGLAYNNRGLAYQQLKQYERALQDYRRAIQINPNHVNAYNNRGYTYYLTGQYQRAIQDFDKVVALKPNFGRAYIDLGNAYDNLGQHERAMQYFNKALQLDPNNSVAYDARGVAYGKLGQYELAIADFNRAIQINPKYTGAYNNRGYAYYLTGQYQRAIQDFDRALAINPNEVKAKGNRKLCYEALGR